MFSSSLAKHRHSTEHNFFSFFADEWLFRLFSRFPWCFSQTCALFDLKSRAEQLHISNMGDVRHIKKGGKLRLAIHMSCFVLKQKFPELSKLSSSHCFSFADVHYIIKFFEQSVRRLQEFMSSLLCCSRMYCLVVARELWSNNRKCFKKEQRIFFFFVYYQLFTWKMFLGINWWWKKFDIKATRKLK